MHWLHYPRVLSC